MADSEAGDEGFAVEGILVAGPPGRVRLVIDQVVIDIEEEDVVEAGELPAPPGLIARLAQPVRLRLRDGARLRGAGSATAYAGAVWEKGELFALRTRRSEPGWEMSESYRRLERAFFAGYGFSFALEPEEAP